jgi:hypothetical protein
MDLLESLFPILEDITRLIADVELLSIADGMSCGFGTDDQYNTIAYGDDDIKTNHHMGIQEDIRNLAITLTVFSVLGLIVNLFMSQFREHTKFYILSQLFTIPFSILATFLSLCTYLTVVSNKSKLLDCDFKHFDMICYLLLGQIMYNTVSIASRIKRNWDSILP